MQAELIDIGLAVRENPVEAVAVIIEALETAAGIDPAAETTQESDAWKGKPVNLREPQA